MTPKLFSYLHHWPRGVMDKSVIFESKGLWSESCLMPTFFFPFFWKVHQAKFFSQVWNNLDLEKLKFQAQMNDFCFHQKKRGKNCLTKGLNQRDLKFQLPLSIPLDHGSQYHWTMNNDYWNCRKLRASKENMAYALWEHQANFEHDVK